MENINILAPEFPESINTAKILKWYKKCGELVQEDEILLEIETDKIILEVSSPTNGILKNQFFLDNSIIKSKEILGIVQKENQNNNQSKNFLKNKSFYLKEIFKKKINTSFFNHNLPNIRKKRILNIDIIKKKNILDENIVVKKKQNINKNFTENFQKKNRKVRLVPFNTLRKKIAERLLFTTQNTAMLTTFSEVNMSCINKIRNKYKDIFFKKHCIKLGYTSFFVKATSEALKLFPELNASIQEDNILFHDYIDINIALSTKRGLITPRIKDADYLKIYEIEKKIKYFMSLGDTGKFNFKDLKSGTFTITNGGIFGSLFSTPIINPPQVAILGIHSIQNRVIVEKNNMKLNPMMYLALSYDHQIIDGKQAIEFLKYIKNIIEDFSRTMLDI